MRAGARLWRKVVVAAPDACWHWQGATVTGYGRVTRGGQQYLVHRLVYGYDRQIPEGWDVHHTCDTRSCVNPRHLVALSRHDHARTKRGQVAAQMRQTTCINGHPFDHITSQGHRGCRLCNAARQRAAYARRKAAA